MKLTIGLPVWVAVFLCINMVHADIFLTVTDDANTISEITLGGIPTDTGAGAITLAPTSTATLLLWSDSNVAIDNSTGAQFGYAIAALVSDTSVVSGVAGTTSVNPTDVNGDQRWTGVFDTGVAWVAIGFGAETGVSSSRVGFDPFYDPVRDAFLLGYATLTTASQGVSDIDPFIASVFSLTGGEEATGVTVTVVPEPSSCTLGFVLLSGLLLHRRK